jgi:hypothetical protein
MRADIFGSNVYGLDLGFAASGKCQCKKYEENFTAEAQSSRRGTQRKTLGESLRNLCASAVKKI